MDQVSLLKAERERHHKALNAALDQAALLRQHVDRAHLLSSESIRDRVAVRLITAPDEEVSSAAAAVPKDQTTRAESPGQLQDTQQMLLEGAKVQHAKVHAQAVAELAADAAALQISSAALDKDEEALRKRFVRKRLSLAAAIEDDARLAGLTEAEILEEVRARGAEMAKRQQLLNAFSSRGPGQQQSLQQRQQGADISGAAYSRPRQAGKVMQPAAMSRRQYKRPNQEPGAVSSSSWRPPGFETEYGAYAADIEDSLGDSTAGAREEQGTDDGQDTRYQEGTASAVVTTGELETEAIVAAGLPGMLKHMTDQRARGLPSNLHLSDVAAALYATLPQQQEKLAAIKRRAAVTSTRLKWQTKRPQTYAGDLALTAHQKSIKSFVQSVIDELISSALAHVAMRPTKQQVAVEVAEWKARKPAALQAISRHVGDSIFREVVDELIGEVASEVAAAAAAANAFSFDMLVAAVAFSQGKYDLGFNVGAGQGSAAAAAGAASGYAGQSKPGGIAREAALLQKAAERESTSDNDDALQAGSTGARLVIKAGDVGAQIAEEDVYIARRDFAAVDHAFAAGLVDSASSGAVRAGGKGGQQEAKASARSLYLAGLRGMLWEMRDRRPADTPYGHTQPLAPHFTQASGTSKARRLAIARQRPPLIASAAVWARREVAVGRLEPGGWPHARHLAAAARERQFWSMVGLKPRMQKPSLPGPAVLTNSSLVVPEALGSITALSPCPAGTFIAAGTNRGGLLVWDLRQDTAVTPWFQVTGTGQLYKRRWWNPWQAKPPRRPAITGFCWSADSYQLAGLDASSNLKVWWMRPEEREDGQSVAELQAKNAPVTPELAVLLTPFMVAISGKAPVAEDDDASTAAANAAAVDAAEAAAAASKSSGSLGQKLGQWLGVSEAQQKGLVRDVPARQWRPVFHPAFTIAGTQPTVVIPQVTGDVLSICTDIGGPILPGFGPTVFAEKAMASKGLAAATAAAGTAAAAATSAAVSTEGASIPQAVVDFLMPPQGENPDIVSQAMYRSHDAHVVFLGYLSDAASLLTLDAYGQLALWPTSTSQRSGFGWIIPRKRWQLPRSIRTCLPRSGLHPVWPALPGRAGRGGSANNSNKSGWGGGNSSVTGSSSTSSAIGSSWMVDGLEQDKEDSELLQQDPQGKFLLDSRLPWMVRYIPSTSSSGSSGLRVLRQVSHRPLDNSAPGSNVLVVSSYDAGSGELIMRAKQRCTFSRAPVKVVAAELTPSKRELIIFCSLAPQQDDPAAAYTFSVSVVNLTSMKALVPRIDTPDPSSGTAPPAYGLSSTLTSLGTEYLFMNLGCAVIGVYSLATGQLVREIATGIVNVKSSSGGGVSDAAGCYFGCLGFLRVSEKQGVFSNAGRTLLAASAAGGHKVYVLEMDVEGAAQRLLEQREQQLLQQPQVRQVQAVSLGPLQRQRTTRVSMQLPARQQQQQGQQPGSQRGTSQQQQQQQQQVQQQGLQGRPSQQQQTQQQGQQDRSQGRPSQQQQQQVQQQQPPANMVPEQQRQPGSNSNRL